MTGLMEQRSSVASMSQTHSPEVVPRPFFQKQPRRGWGAEAGPWKTEKKISGTIPQRCVWMGEATEDPSFLMIWTATNPGWHALTVREIQVQPDARVSAPVQTRSTDEQLRLERLLPSFEPGLLEVARNLCGDPSEAKDLVQDTFERALRSTERPPTEERLRAWLFTILRNLFLDRCRRLRARAEREEPLEPEVVESCSAPEPGPEPGWSTITTDQLRTALGGLKEDFRRVYEMHELEGRTYEEIARQLQIARPTVGTRLVRARQKLRELLAPLIRGEAEVSRD
ncbi:RNA polymerase sigma factor [Archangium minus]|uniref:RNA polymerase sigma factor n=1 Tax=Archangium minus TaxID=83450 RepID=A0ABY9WNW7_9BACT|nr:RNA polymerase sigma factor [Archangium minus]